MRTSEAIRYASGDTTNFFFDAEAPDLLQLAPPENSILITDEHLASIYADFLSAYRVLHFPAGEASKSLSTLGSLTEKLLALGAHRQTLLLGFGGGVVTDLVGFLASSFMRGLPFGFVPTTLLGQVDAAIGGKNGVNVGLHKNMLGVVRQPAWLLFSHTWLRSLPELHWQSGMAEIIKYGYLADTRILSLLQHTPLRHFQQHPGDLNTLIRDSVFIKNKIVMADEREASLRRILNFGHTAGHALERLYDLPHGHAVGLGMRVAMRLSEMHTGLSGAEDTRLQELLLRFGLPVHQPHDTDAVMEILLHDKKRQDGSIEYVLLEKPGVPVRKRLQAEAIREALAVLG